MDSSDNVSTLLPKCSSLTQHSLPNYTPQLDLRRPPILEDRHSQQVVQLD